MEETTEIQMAEQATANAITIQNIGTAAPGTSLRAVPGDRAASVRIFNAMNNPGERVANHINEVIEVQDYLIEMAQIEDTDAYGNGLGTYSNVPRVVLVSPDGTSYQAVSYGVANAVRNATLACGDAPWKPAIKLKIKQVPTKRGSMLTVDMVG